MPLKQRCSNSNGKSPSDGQSAAAAIGNQYGVTRTLCSAFSADSPLEL
jgi:hypothetical protein